MKGLKFILISIVLVLGIPLAFSMWLFSCAAMDTQQAAAASCNGTGAAVGGPPSKEAQDAIPSNLMPIYHAAQRKYKVQWYILAAINKVETDFGRNMNVSSAGAIGWMQFMPSTWAAYGVDANGDSKKDPYNPQDAIFAAAKYLRASGAPGDIRQAIFAYNHADWYVEDVLEYARKYGLGSPIGSPVELAGSCELANTGIPGKVKIAPGANKPGQPLKKELLQFLAEVAGIYGKPVVVSTGTNHSYYTVNGNVSDHATGHAADLGMAANGWPTLNDPGGDKLATAALIVAGDPPAVARQNALTGGIHNRTRNGLRIQIIWRCSGIACGGDHTNHVHIGVQPL